MMLYNLKAGGTLLSTADAIKRAAEDWQVKAKYGNISVTIAAIYDGYVTAVTQNGGIIQDWAGYFTITDGGEEIC